MRTKSLCLAAAAVLGGLLTASAQSNVYSLNVVGYVNVELKPGYNLVANPLDDGNGNQSTNLVPAALPTKSQVVVFTPPSTYSTATKLSSGWNANFNIAPGNGFFVKNNGGTSLTNTFVGNVAGSLPGSITNTLAAGYNLVGSPYPIGGSSTNVGSNSLNFAASLPTKSQVVVFSNPSTYSTATKLSSGWNAAFNIGVGEGFFIKNNGSPLQWVQDVGP